MERIKVYVNCEDFVKIEIGLRSRVEVFYDSDCRGEYWGCEGKVWKGLGKIIEGVVELNREMEMGESRVWWIKVDDKVVYGDKEGWKDWKEDRELDWEDFRDGNEEGDENVGECRKLLDGLNEKNWFDLKYVGKISMMLSCF